METLLYVVAISTLVASFLCSLFEAALYAITPSQVELIRREGRPGGERLARLREDIEEPIAAILTVNTVAHTVGAAWCGALVAEIYGSAAVGIFAAIFTVLVLAVTEIVPKSIGVRYARSIGPRVAFPIQIMIWLVWPIARPARAIMRRLTGEEESGGPSEEEVLVFSRLAASGGNVRAEEHEWVRNALELDRVRARDVLTPRTVVETRNSEETVGSAAADPVAWKHSRVPITEGTDRDKIVGVVFRREVFDAALAGQTERTMADLMHPVRFVPESLRGHELLRIFIRERRHIVLVADEYGGFEGIVTLEDVIESLLGEEIVDEHDEHADMQELARERARPTDDQPGS